MPLSPPFPFAFFNNSYLAMSTPYPYLVPSRFPLFPYLSSYVNLVHSCYNFFLFITCPFSCIHLSRFLFIIRLVPFLPQPFPSVNLVVSVSVFFSYSSTASSFAFSSLSPPYPPSPPPFPYNPSRSPFFP